MYTVNLDQCKEFIAGDGSNLRELLHPDKADLKLRYSLAHAIVKPGATLTPHVLTTSEVYYILSGKGVMHIGEETEVVFPGTAIYIPPHALQYIHNPGQDNLIFLCIVDPAWRIENETVLSR